MDYLFLNGLQSDFQRENTSAALSGLPWTFVNLLPIPVKVYRRRQLKTDFIGLINKTSNLVTSNAEGSDPLSKGDEIHIVYDAGDGSAYEIIRPDYLREDTRTVRIGDIVYDYKDTSYLNSHADISGIRVHNRLTTPITIYHKTYKLAQIEGDNGTSFMTGAPNSVYINNDYHGFRVGDELRITLTNTGIDYSTIMLNDNYMKNVYVGVLNQKYNPPTPDTFTYRVDAPNFTGFTYYMSDSFDGQSKNVGSKYARGTYAYRTYKTNPEAPF